MHLGHAIMSFYAALIDLLGRCAPEMHVSSERSGGVGKSWVYMTDLQPRRPGTRQHP